MGKLILYCRIIMWDLGIPQLVATITYEDNDAAISMANARRPTSRTRHIDIKWHILCQWVEQDLITLERAPTAINIADIFTKQLGPLLFKRHCDYLMGRIPPKYSSTYHKCYCDYKNWELNAKLKPTETVTPSFPLNPFTAAAEKFVTSWFCITNIYSNI